MRRHVKTAGAIAVAVAATQARRLYDRASSRREAAVEAQRTEVVDSYTRGTSTPPQSAGKPPSSVFDERRRLSPARPRSGAEPVAARPRAVARPVATAPSRGHRIAVAAAVLAMGSVGGLIAGSVSDSDAGGGSQGRAVAAYERALDREVEALAAARTAKLEQLEEARTPADQAAAIEGLESSHRQAARALSRSLAPARLRDPGESLTRALTRTADAYQSLADAAATRSAGQYEAAQDEARQAEAVLQRRLDAVRDL